MTGIALDSHANGAGDAVFDPVMELIDAWRRTQNDASDNIGLYRLTPRPYPGLKSFAPAEASVFFGREGQDRKLARLLERTNLLGVLGGSGSGKSSLVKAGLLPYLR